MFHRTSRVLTLIALSFACWCAPLRGAEPAEWTVESIDADAGTITVKNIRGQTTSVTVEDAAVLKAFQRGQTIGIDAAAGTITATVTVPLRTSPSAPPGEMKSSANAAKGKKTTRGSTPVKVDSSQVTASEGSTATAIRGRPGRIEKDLGRLEGIVGKSSDDEENEDAEPDPEFAPVAFVPLSRGDSPPLESTGSSATRMKDHPKAKEFAQRVAEALSKKEINVALLGGRKYMVHDCLGIKASAGEFTLKLANPSVRIEDAGVIMEFKIDKVSMNALKVRMRPNLGNPLKPCKFSKRFEVGGAASDVRVEFRMDPLLDLDRCRVSQFGNYHVFFRIGGLNLKPLQNDLDKVAKNMIEDSITFALEYAATGGTNTAMKMQDQIIQTIDDILEIDCPGRAGGTAKSAEEGMKSVGVAATASEQAAFEQLPNPLLKGRLGRIVIAYPKDTNPSNTRWEIGKPDAPSSGGSGYGPAQVDLMPGKYVVSVSKKKVADVEVSSRHDTVLKVGILRVHSGPNTRVEILDADKKAMLTSGYGDMEVGLPIGSYHVKIAGSAEPVTIEAGKVQEF